MDVPDEQKLVLGVARFLFGQIRTHHGLPRPEVSLMDRAQNANLNAVRAALSFDNKRKSSFISYIKPHLDNSIKRVEQGESSDLHQGDIIRVPLHRAGYYQVKNLLYGLSMSARKHWGYDQPVGLDEATSLSWITLAGEAVGQYRQNHIEHQPFHLTSEVEDIIDDDPETQPGAQLLSEAAIDAVLSHLLPDQGELLVSRFGLNGKPPQKQAEIAENEGVTQQAIYKRVSQLTKRLQEIPAVHDLLYS
jgi:RNA polymerase sigma factor (sigma-70 family)